VAVYGSVARGESWPLGIPIRSDLDLLVVTEEPVAEDVVARLVDETYPLFLESGRVIGSVFRTQEQLANPETERAAEFGEQARRDAIPIYARGA
jgi:predicted nucleotidyltransferase